MIEFNMGRERPANYIQICNTLADTYPFGVYHGLQKDAIQNSVDARRGKGKVYVSFELIENKKGKFIIITDNNTSGLTGSVLYDVKDYDLELPSDYHWARFESFAFTKEDPEAIGARGQGKFIFLRSSKTYTMYYDTLLQDGVYRVGGTQATQTGCPILPPKNVKPWEGEIGAQELLNRVGLTPLKVVGARIIIVDPIEEVCDTFFNGELLKAIEETWFRLLDKQLLHITVTSNSDSKSAQLPFIFPLANKDSSNTKVWKLGSDFREKFITLTGGEKFRIKNFHAVLIKNQDIPEGLRGISIIHNGMKITSLEMTTAPENIKDQIVGYIEFDTELDRELRKGENQHPNHYDLKWRRRIPHAIKYYVNRQLEEFGVEKLGLRKDPRQIQKRRRTSAEDWAIQKLMKFVNDLDLFGAKGSARPSISVDPAPMKPIGVSINNFSYPNPEIAPRVNWGDNFSDLTVTSYNKSKYEVGISLLVQILIGDAIVFLPIERISMRITKNSQFCSSSFKITVDEDRFNQPGMYRLNATIFGSKTGDKIDSVSRRFWVESDPPLRQPFELEPLAEFPEPYKYLQWYTSGSINNSPILYYNMSHPQYRIVEEEDDQDMLNEYIFDIALNGAIQFILNRPNKVDGSPDFHPLVANNILGQRESFEKEEIPNKTYEEVNRFISEVRWKIFEGI